MRYRSYNSIRVEMRLLILGCLAICIISLSCSDTDDAAEIRGLIEKGSGLAETHDIGDILGLATRDVRAMPGNLDKRQIKGVLWKAFNHYGPFNVLYPHPLVDVDDTSGQASAQFPFLVVKKDQDYPELKELASDPMAWIEAVGKTADLYRMKLQLTKQDGDWSVYRVHLERFAGQGLQ